VGGGQGALRGVRAHAERGRVQGAHRIFNVQPSKTQAASHRFRSVRRSAACHRWGRSALGTTTPRSRHAATEGPQEMRMATWLTCKARPQVVDEIFDTWAANKMGIDRIGQVCVMIHSGSRGLGHQVRVHGLTLCKLHHVAACVNFGPLSGHRWQPTRWSRWRRRWRATASIRTTGSSHARELTPRRDRTTWCVSFSRLLPTIRALSCLVALTRCP